MSLLSIAPMLDITDRHCRAFYRLFSPQLKLYTEMIHVGAILYGDRERFLKFNPKEHPVVIQFGGSNPRELSEAAKIAEDWGYDEINLNVGCPSDKVQAGRFGACLMREPTLVAECVAQMCAAVNVPVTVKHRIGVDDQDEDEALNHFIELVSAAGCTEFTVHARKAWLKGLSPKENRDVPPLNYGRVYRLVKNHPQLRFVMNGGITTSAAVHSHLTKTAGVMLGRVAFDDPWMLNQLCADVFKHSAAFKSRRDIVETYCEYIDEQLAQGVWLRHMSKHLMGLFKGEAGAKQWRRTMAEDTRGEHRDCSAIKHALDQILTTTI